MHQDESCCIFSGFEVVRKVKSIIYFRQPLDRQTVPGGEGFMIQAGSGALFPLIEQLGFDLSNN